MRILLSVIFAATFSTSAQSQDFAQKIPKEISLSERSDCFSISAQKGWQRILRKPAYKMLLVIDKTTIRLSAREKLSRDYEWSVDAVRYAPVGAEGHTGDAAAALEPFLGFKYDKAHPFGALLARSLTNEPALSMHETGLVQDFSELMKWVEFRINDTSFADNSGAIQVCALAD